MMDNVEKAVLDEAKKEAKAILAAASAAFAEKVAAEKRRLDADIEALRRQENSRLDAEHSRSLASEHAAQAGAVLAEKNRILDEVFSRALHRLGELPKPLFLAAAGRRLSEVPGRLPAVIEAGARERSYIEGAFLDGINAKRRDGAKLTLSDECELGPAGGGLLVRAGRFVFDHSWNTALSERKGELVPEMAAELFGKLEGAKP